MKQYTRSLLSRALCGAALIGLFALAGCGAKDSQPPPGSGQPDKFLYDRGNSALNDKKWLRAREYFRQLVDNYPQSPLRPDAKLALGDTYLGEDTVESLILAENEFREFLTFYPTHPRADYAQYKLGLGHFAQMLGPQRDQTQTKEAIAEFEEFIERFPNSKYLPEVRAKFREARDRLSDAEWEVGIFYHRSRWYPGAIDRFKSILKQDPQYSKRDAVYYYLAEALMRVQLAAEAVPYLDRLIKEFEQSEYLDRAKKLMDEAKNVAPVKAEVKEIKKS
ncbi:MAG: outer membrane protein assembly factor BamD [Acidobacteria bacterium]|nr:MAG: outer membrane protein assembly factor BamD [Acidobacteriota bacterium]